MIGFSVVQIVFAAAAVWFGAQAAMGFGRDLRRDLFHQVTDYSAREVGRFGAASLITRITNDVQQVQMLVVLAATMMIAAPLTMVIGIVLAIREDVGLSVILLFAMPGAVAAESSEPVPPPFTNRSGAPASAAIARTAATARPRRSASSAREARWMPRMSALRTGRPGTASPRPAIWPS